MVDYGNHKVALSATGKPEIDVNSPCSFCMRMQASINNDCRLPQCTDYSARLFGTIGFHAVKNNLNF